MHSLANYIITFSSCYKYSFFFLDFLWLPAFTERHTGAGNVDTSKLTFKKVRGMKFRIVARYVSV